MSGQVQDVNNIQHVRFYDDAQIEDENERAILPATHDREDVDI